MGGEGGERVWKCPICGKWAKGRDWHYCTGVKPYCVADNPATPKPVVEEERK